MSNSNFDRTALGSSREDWGRVKKAVQYAEAALGYRFNGDGHVRSATYRGWLRRRLRELLESFPTAEDAQTWVKAACFKALRNADRPMAYFAALVKGASNDARMRELLGLLTVNEYRAFKLEADQPRGHGTSGSDGE